MADGSDSSDEASLSTAASRASSVESSAPVFSLRHGVGAAAARGESVEVSKLRLQREQKLRRLLSLRHLGQPETIAHNAFFCTRSSLSEEDVVWLYALTNHACFQRLLCEVRSTQSSLAGHLDAILSNSNPLFHFNYRMPVEAPQAVAESRTSTEEDGAARDVSLLVEESPVMQRWDREATAIQRKRPPPEEWEKGAKSDTAGAFPAADGNSGGSAWKDAKKACGTSASSGLVAQSMKAWEAHLTASLMREGETIENFRQARTKSSYVEKQSFQQRAEWNEFAREVALQQQQRDREATRALRRGEVDE